MPTRASGSRPITPERKARLVLLGVAISTCRKAADMSQAELGRALGRVTNEPPTPQTTISRWELGEVHMLIEQVWDIELALGLTPGTIFKMAKYVAEHQSLASLVLVDPEIHDELKGLVRDTINHYIKYSRELRERDREAIEAVESPPTRAVPVSGRRRAHLAARS